MPRLALAVKRRPQRSRSVRSQRRLAYRPEAAPSDRVANGWSLAYRASATLVFIAWACGSLSLLLRLARSWLIRRTDPPLFDAHQRRFRAVPSGRARARALDVSSDPRSSFPEDVPTPVAFGFWRPIIVVPDRLIGAVNDDEMRMCFCMRWLI